MHYDKQMLADLNRALVLELITKKGPINRAEIARQLELSIPTIMKIVESFEKAGIISVVGKGESTGGKRPELYEIIKEAYYGIGVDIGRSKINIVLINLKGEVEKKQMIPARKLQTAEEFISKIIEGIELLLVQFDLPREKLMGIGMGIPGILNPEKGIIEYSPDFGWENVDIVKPIREKFQTWVVIENSNRTMALAEKWIGIGQSASLIFCVNVGHGIGAAILHHDDIYIGSSGTSGEFGHVVLQKDGPICDCGNRGCLESLAAGNAIAKKMGMEEAKDVFELMRQGDAKATQVIREAIEYLGIGIAGAINLLDPELVILAGRIMNSKDLYWEYLLQVIKEHQMSHAGTRVKIKPGILGEDGTAIGAAVLLIRNFKNNGGQVE